MSQGMTKCIKPIMNKKKKIKNKKTKNVHI